MDDLSIASNNGIKKRGRPPSTVVDKIRTQVWYADLKSKAGASNPNQLESILFPENFKIGPNGEDRRTKIFYQYKCGDTTPKEKMVKRVESLYRGTQYWLEHPLWKVIDKKPLTPFELYNIIAQIKPNLAACLDDTKYKPASARNKNYDFRSPHSIDSLFRQGDINALTVLIGLIRHATYMGDFFLLADASTTATYLSLLVLSKKPLFNCCYQLFDYLSQHYFSNSFTSTIYFNTCDIDDIAGVLSIRDAIKIAERNNLIGNSSHDHGRLVYWLLRESFFVNGYCILADLVNCDDSDSYLQSRLNILRKRLQMNELSNPRRTNILENALFNRNYTSEENCIQSLKELEEKRRLLAKRTSKELKYL